MKPGPLAIRADGGEGIGVGHVMRCIALADGWRRAGGTVEWFAAALPTVLVRTLEERGIAYHALPHADAWDRLEAWTASNRRCWVVVDGYPLSAGPSALRRAGARVLVVDDDAVWPEYDCDALLNQNLDATTLSYRTSAKIQLLGPSYVLLRDEFRRVAPPVRTFDAPAKRLFISFGGHDAYGQAGRLARLVGEAMPSMEAVVAAGFGPEKLAGAREARVRWETGTNLSRAMYDADIAVVAAGTVCWELAYMGLPALTLIVADNQVAVARSFDAAGAARTLGWFRDVSDDTLLKSIEWLARAPERSTMHAVGRRLVDGAGADRVVTALCADQVRHIVLRRATMDDAEILYRWRQDPLTRANSHQTGTTTYEEHVEWLESALRTPSRRLYMAVDAESGDRLGTARLDVRAEIGDISITVDPQRRGEGHAVRILQALIDVASRDGLRQLSAEVKPTNSPSLRAFRAAGFEAVTSGEIVRFTRPLAADVQAPRGASRT